MLVTKHCVSCRRKWVDTPVEEVTCPHCYAALKDERVLDATLPVEEIRRMVAGGTTSKEVIARMYGLTPEQLEEILKCQQG